MTERREDPKPAQRLRGIKRLKTTLEAAARQAWSLKLKDLALAIENVVSLTREVGG